jgi:hypothetical protein
LLSPTKGKPIGLRRHPRSRRHAMIRILFHKRGFGGRRVRSGSKTVLTPLKWDVCITTESRHRSGYAADCDVIVCYDGAKVADKHLASTVHCVDDEIIGWLKRREQRRRDRPCPASFPRTVKCSR